MGKLHLHSIFSSFSGEVGLIPQGAMTTFIRLGGCNIRCAWCDTEQALTTEGSEKLKVQEVVDRAVAFGNHFYLITGGEPLMQKNIADLVQRLAISGPGITIQIETNGSLFPSPEVRDCTDCFVFDYKLEGSGVKSAMMDLGQFGNIPDSSYIKFVVDSWHDFKTAVIVRQSIKAAASMHGAVINFAWSAGPNLHKSALATWVLDEKFHHDLFNVQIHKSIFPDGEKEK